MSVKNETSSDPRLINNGQDWNLEVETPRLTVNLVILAGDLSRPCWKVFVIIRLIFVTQKKIHQMP